MLYKYFSAVLSCQKRKLMKIEDLGNEVDALFEEDSVLAQAVVDLQNRRKKISAEKNTT